MCSSDLRIVGSNLIYEVVEVNERRGNIETITLESKGVEEDYFVSRDLLIFGDSDVRKGDDIAFAVNDDDEIIVIAVY